MSDLIAVAGAGLKAGAYVPENEGPVADFGAEVSIGAGIGLGPKEAQDNDFFDKLKRVPLSLFDQDHRSNISAQAGVLAYGSSTGGGSLTPHAKVLFGNTYINGGGVVGYRSNFDVGTNETPDHVVFGGEINFLGLFGARVLFDENGLSSVTGGLQVALGQ